MDVFEASHSSQHLSTGTWLDQHRTLSVQMKATWQETQLPLSLALQRNPTRPSLFLSPLDTEPRLLLCVKGSQSLEQPSGQRGREAGFLRTGHGTWKVGWATVHIRSLTWRFGSNIRDTLAFVSTLSATAPVNDVQAAPHGISSREAPSIPPCGPHPRLPWTGIAPDELLVLGA